MGVPVVAACAQDCVTGASWLGEELGGFGPVARVSPQACEPVCRPFGACSVSVLTDPPAPVGPWAAPGLADTHNPGAGLLGSKCSLDFSPL